jgi:hypothetical protein
MINFINTKIPFSIEITLLEEQKANNKIRCMSGRFCSKANEVLFFEKNGPKQSVFYRLLFELGSVLHRAFWYNTNSDTPL